MSLIKLLFCCFQDDKIIVIYKQLKLNMIDLEYMKKNNNKMGVGLIMLVVAVIFLGFGFIYINKHNQSTNNNKKNVINAMVKMLLKKEIITESDIKQILKDELSEEEFEKLPDFYKNNQD